MAKNKGKSKEDIVENLDPEDEEEILDEEVETEEEDNIEEAVTSEVVADLISNEEVYVTAVAATTIIHNGVIYYRGNEISLVKEQAKQLLKRGLVTKLAKIEE